MNRIAREHSTSVAAFVAAALALALVWPAASFGDNVAPHVIPTADTDSCAACHSGHTTADALRPGLGIVAEGEPSAVCLPCHALDSTAAPNVVTGSRDSFGLPSGHSLTEASAGDVHMKGCEACHDTHGASSVTPMLPNSKIGGVQVASSGPDECLACHAQSATWYGPGYPSTSAPTRDASGYPVAGTWPGSATYSSASNGHRLIPESTQTIAPGGGIKRQQGDCLYCHAAHRGPNAYDGLLATFTVPAQETLAADKTEGSYAAACFECHGGVKPSGFATAPVDIKRFATSGNLAAGHSIVTSGGTLPVGAPLPCFECHNPHGSSRGNTSMLSDERGGSLETSTAAGVRHFCFTCHSTSDTVGGWDSDSKSYVDISADKVVGLPRNGGALRLRAENGHAEGDVQSCYECHGDQYAVDGKNVHDPQVDGQLALQIVTRSSTVASDTSAPMTTADVAAAYSGVVSLVATDFGSGVAQTYYSLDAGVLSTGTIVSTSADGTHTLEFWSVDLAGNVETPTVTSFVVDRTAPVTTSDALASYVDSATITLVSQDNTGGAGVSATYWRLDGGEVTTGTIVSTAAAGSHTLDFWSVDAAGNAESPQTLTFVVDVTQALLGAPPSAVMRVLSRSPDPTAVGLPPVVTVRAEPLV